MLEFKTVTILGANGTMGAGSAGVIAAFGGCRIHMLARSVDKAKEGIAAACGSVRAGVIEPRLIPGSYDADLEKAVAESDWVFELVAETYDVKEPLNKRVAAARKKGSLISTVSSGLDIARLASHFDADGAKHYYGTHFFNPPYKLTLCELITHPGNDRAYTAELATYLQKVLRREVVVTSNLPGFAGNRIGFQFMNEVAQKAEELQDAGGIHLLDSLLSGYTGRAMSPLATVDLVGLDVHKAIVDNIYENTKDLAHSTFKMPAYMQKLIDSGAMGNKAGKGLYLRKKNPDGSREKLVWNIKKGVYEALPPITIPFKKAAIESIRGARYSDAAEIFKTAQGVEADLLRYFIARYISYSLSLVPEVTDQNGVDAAMGFGFNWTPPSAWVDFLGGVDETKRLMEQNKVEIPEALSTANGKGRFYGLYRLNYRQLFRAG